MESLLINGKITPASDFNPVGLWLAPSFSIEASMWFAHGRIPFLGLHLSIIREQLQDVGVALPPSIPDGYELNRLFNRLINKNKAFMGGWLKFFLYPEHETIHYIARVIKYPTREFPFSQQGKLANLAPDKKYSGNRLGRYASFSAGLWGTASVRLTGTRFGLTLICNEYGDIVESPSGNIFYIYGNTLATPSLSTGCYVDTFRSIVLQAALKSGFTVDETDKCTIDLLNGAEELFLVSEAHGFQWIMGIESRRFVKTKTEVIWQNLEKMIWEPVS